MDSPRGADERMRRDSGKTERARTTLCVSLLSENQRAVPMASYLAFLSLHSRSPLLRRARRPVRLAPKLIKRLVCVMSPRHRRP